MAAVVVFSDHLALPGTVIGHVSLGSAIPDTRPAKVFSDQKATAAGRQVILFDPRKSGNQD